MNTPLSAVQRGIRPQNILVCTDFSENASCALPYAAEYARQFGARVVLVHIVEPAPILSGMEDVPLALSEKQLTQTAKDNLEALATQTLAPEIQYGVEVRTGTAYAEIAKAAKDVKADLVVIATHGYTGLKHTLLGSTAERVVRQAPCPVLVVRQQE